MASPSSKECKEPAVDDNCGIHDVSTTDDNCAVRQNEVRTTARMRKLWQENLLCDVQLRVGIRSFLAHRNMLASVSDYFWSMFTSAFKESTQQEVELCDVTADAVSLLLDHVYGVRITVDDANLQELLHAASFLQFTQVQEMCVNYMVDKADDTNCTKFLLLADRYNMATCVDLIHLCVLKNFVSVSLQSDFHDIPLASLITLLDDDRLIAHTELDVFNAVCRWLTVKESILAENLDSTAYQLFSLVRFQQLTGDDMSKVYCEPLMCTATCLPILKTALDHHLKFSSKRPAPGPMRSVNSSMRILGADVGNCTNIENVLDIEIHDDTMEFTDCGEKYMGAGVAVVDGSVYVAGGYNNARFNALAKMAVTTHLLDNG